MVKGANNFTDIWGKKKNDSKIDFIDEFVVDFYIELLICMLQRILN